MLPSASKLLPLIALFPLISSARDGCVQRVADLDACGAHTCRGWA